MRTRTWILIALILAAAGYTRFLSDVHAVPLKRPLADIPLDFGEWRGRSDQMEEQVTEIVGVEDYLLRDYRTLGGEWVAVYVGFYEQQAEGDQIHSPKHCLPGAGWRPVVNDMVEFATPGFNGGRTRANRYVIGKGEARQLVLYWYQSRGRNITNEYAAKVWLVADSIFRKRNDGALIRLISPLGPGVTLDAAQESTVRFAEVFLSELDKSLPD